MFYVYLLHSLKDNGFYTGYSTDLKRRLSEHTAGASLAMDDALTLARGAEQLRRGADARRLIAAAHLLRRDFAAAWQWYHV